MRDPVNGQGLAAIGGEVGVTPEAYDALVASIYAARDEAGWHAPMTESARVAGATALQLVCVQPVSRQIVVSVPVGAAARSRVGDWLPDGLPDGTRQRALWDMKEGDRLCWTGDLADRFGPEDRWWQDTVRVSRAAEVIVMRLLDRPGVSAWVLVMRPAIAPTLAAETLQWMHRAKGHVARALELQVDALRRPMLRNGARVARRLSDVLLDQLCHAVMLVGPDGDIRYANRRATEALADGRALHARDGTLVCPHPADDRQLRAALRLTLGSDAWSPTRADAQGRAVEVRLSVGHGTRVLFVSRLSAQGEQVALVVEHDTADIPRHDATLVGRVFNLTPAEARIATMLAQGLTPEQISEKQGTTLATVRSQIKALFVKTGTNRQVDVVRMVASLPAFEALRVGTQPLPGGAGAQGPGARGFP